MTFCVSAQATHCMVDFPRSCCFLENAPHGYLWPACLIFQWQFERATRSKPDVGPVWPMQCACMTLKHWENDRYWLLVRMQEAGINHYELSKTCHHTQVGSFVTSCGCAQSREAIQNHWLVDYSTCAASITELGLSYNPRIVICHIKEIAAKLCHLLPIPE